MKPFKSLLALSIGLGVIPMASASGAVSYPDRPIRLVVPYAVGGATDVIGRVMARYLGEALGQSIVVENKPGAGGSTGSQYASKQPADGYTLVMMVESSHAVNPNVYSKPAYDPVKDFTAITNIANVPGVMVVNVSSNYKTAQDVIDAARKAPGKLNYGSSGNGGLSHLSGALFGDSSNTQITHVPYKGLGPALNDLMSGQIDVVFDNMPSSGGADFWQQAACPGRLKSEAFGQSAQCSDVCGGGIEVDERHVLVRAGRTSRSGPCGAGQAQRRGNESAE